MSFHDSSLQILTRATAPYLSRSRHQNFARATRSDRYDVIIVGAGQVGLSEAYYLAKQGLKVAIVEKHVAGCKQSGNSGGVILDTCETSIKELCRKYGDRTAARILRASHDGTFAIHTIAQTAGFQCGYKRTGYLTGFRTIDDAEQYKESYSIMRRLLPDIYPQNYETLAPRQTGAPHYFRAGAAYSAIGGIFNPQIFLKNLIHAIQDAGVDVFEGTSVEDFEPAHDGVRLITKYANLEAHQVLLAGGNTSELFQGVEGFPHTQEILAAMIATEPLSYEVLETIGNIKNIQIPVLSYEPMSPVYFRFDSDRRLLLGCGGSIGPNAKSLIMEDVRKTLFDVFPMLHGIVDFDRCCKWGRRLPYSDSRFPFAYAADSSGNLMQWPEKPQRDKKGMLRGTPIMGVAGFGGQGNNFGPHLGKLNARAVMESPQLSNNAYGLLREFHLASPTKALTEPEARRRLNVEKRARAHYAIAWS